MGTRPTEPSKAAKGATATLPRWAAFAGLVLIIAGGFNLINGFTALQHSGYYNRHIVYSNLTFWGWVFLLWGGLQLLAGGLVLARNAAGSLIGIIISASAAILWFCMIFAAPWAALLGVTVNLLVLHGLTAGAGVRGQWGAQTRGD